VPTLAAVIHTEPGGPLISRSSDLVAPHGAAWADVRCMATSAVESHSPMTHQVVLEAPRKDSTTAANLVASWNRNACAASG
jgi:hypothetical protein